MHNSIDGLVEKVNCDGGEQEGVLIKEDVFVAGRDNVDGCGDVALGWVCEGRPGKIFSSKMTLREK